MKTPQKVTKALDDAEQADLMVVPGYKVSTAAKPQAVAEGQEDTELMVVAGYRVTDPEPVKKQNSDKGSDCAYFSHDDENQDLRDVDDIDEKEYAYDPNDDSTIEFELTDQPHTAQKPKVRLEDDSDDEDYSGF